MNRFQPLAITGVIACTIALSACSSSPTGRQQVLLFSEQDMSQLGAQSFDALKKQEKIHTDNKTNQYVQCVTDALTTRLGANKPLANGKSLSLTANR